MRDYREDLNSAVHAVRTRRDCYPEHSEVHEVLTRVLADLAQITESQK